jgi:hypothetical protein
MDPNIDPTITSNIPPSHTEDELTKVSNANSEQSIRRSTSTGTDQVAQTVTTSTATPTGESTKTESSVGATPAAAQEYSQKKTLFHAYQVVWYILGFIEIVLAFRFILKILGTNPDAGFSRFIYGLSMPFAGPFASMFQPSTTQGFETTSFFEWSTIVAAFVYLIIAWGIIKIFKLGKPTDPNEVVNTVNSQ